MVQRHNTRAAWWSVPVSVRHAVDEQLGSPIVDAINVAGGFSPGPAAVCTLANGTTVFVKACGSELNSFTPTMHRQEAAILHEGIVGGGVIRIGAYEGGAVGFGAFGCFDGEGVAGRAEEVALLGHGRRQGGDPLERLGVLDGEIPPPFLVLGQGPAPPEALLVLLELHERGAEGAEAVGDGVVEARHEAHHGDHRGHARHDAEQREEAAQLLGHHGPEGEADVLGADAAESGSARGHGHSARIASMTTRFDAR